MSEPESCLGETPFSLGEDKSDSCVHCGLGAMEFHVSGFDLILNLLSDGKYHAFEDLYVELKFCWNETQLEVVLALFQQWGFIKRVRKHWSVRTRAVIVQPEMLNFLNRLKELKELGACKK